MPKQIMMISIILFYYLGSNRFLPVFHRALVFIFFTIGFLTLTFFVLAFYLLFIFFPIGLLTLKFLVLTFFLIIFYLFSSGAASSYRAGRFIVLLDLAEAIPLLFSSISLSLPTVVVD